MSKEKSFQFSPEKITPASEQEKELPKILKDLHEVKGEFLASGVFFDVYNADIENEAKKPFVIKDFRSGDATMPQQEQAALFQHQYYEWMNLQNIIGKDFFPESYWVRSPEFSEEEAHGFFEKPGKTANTFREYIKVQLDRHLRDRSGNKDEKKITNKLAHRISSIAGTPKKEGPFIGAIVQEKINGVSFEEALKRLDKNSDEYARLQENTRNLIRGLRAYHEQSDYAAFTWHRSGSNNVMFEIDDMGKLTGRVSIVDANFSERPNKTYKNTVVKKLEKDILQELEDKLEL